MCEFHGSNGNGFGDIWWTDNPIYFSLTLMAVASSGKYQRSLYLSLHAIPLHHFTIIKIILK